MRRRILAIGAAAALALSGLAVPAHAADQAQLSVLHGVPDLTVDVYVNGERTLNNFKPGTLAGPVGGGGFHRGDEIPVSSSTEKPPASPSDARRVHRPVR